jgi:hypothetical protein
LITRSILIQLILHQKMLNSLKVVFALLLVSQVPFLCFVRADNRDSVLNIPEKASQELPPGVPRVVQTNGTVLFIDSRFTTTAFQDEALSLVISEANKVANELHLAESMPITSTNIMRSYISPFGFAYKSKKIGNISTSHYTYGVEQDYKFSDLTIADYDKHVIDYRATVFVPNNDIDTNSAYQLAAQWLKAIRVNVDGLNRDCRVRVALSSDLDGTERPQGKCTPIYVVSWTPRKKVNRYDRGAYVELFLPTQTLLQLSVSSPRYIMRQQIGFTNLAALFPGNAVITTNNLVPIKDMSAPPAISPPWLQHPPRQ